jgi:hypothetical protein
VNNDSIRRQPRSFKSTALLAGLAGGVVEMVWVAGYCAVSPLSSSEVLRQISLSVGLNAGNGALASISGMAVHLGLSALLGLAFTLIVWRPSVRHSGIVGCLLASCGVLSLIWAFNFFLLLPSLNPNFAGLMPYGVTLGSKLLFGIAMGWVLHRAEHQRLGATSAPALCAV